MTVMYIIDVPLDALILENGGGQAVDASYFVKDAGETWRAVELYEEGHHSMLSKVCKVVLQPLVLHRRS
jgi:hypothetical protein